MSFRYSASFETRETFSGDLADSTRFANPRRALLRFCAVCRAAPRRKRKGATPEQESSICLSKKRKEKPLPCECDEVMIQSSNNALPTLLSHLTT
jgi:hypothetical protein